MSNQQQQSLHAFDIASFKNTIDSLDVKVSAERKYYALSTHFLSNHQDYQATSQQKTDQSLIWDANDALIEKRQKDSLVLKEGLRHQEDYVVIDKDVLDYLKGHYICSEIAIAKNERFGRCTIYKYNVNYLILDRVSSLHKEDTIKMNKFQVFADDSIEEIADKIMRKEADRILELQRGKNVWLLTNKQPSTYGQLFALSKSNDDLRLCPVSMFYNNPRFYMIQRKYRTFSLIIQLLDQGTILNPVKQKCYQHNEKQVVCVCLCLDEHSYACSQRCFLDSRKRHTERCIYMPKFQPEHLLVNKAKWLTYYQGQQKDQGLNGLYNQKNMCFFNSVIQCLLHINALTKYFLSFKEIQELNFWNTDGAFGEVAIEYGQLVRSYWFSQDYRCNMSMFKTASRWNPIYSRKTQQDAHQFLIKMLDWLKEDLNRNERKPSYFYMYTANKDDAQIFATTLSMLKKRNDSIIERNMEGLSKSTIKCNICRFTSTNFGSFLTIQLPMANPIKVETSPSPKIIFYVPCKIEDKIIKIKIAYFRHENLFDVKKKIKTLLERHEYEVDLYKVTMGQGIRKISNQNMQAAFEEEIKDEVVFCMERLKANQMAQNIEVVLVFKQQGKIVPFSRPLHYTKMAQRITLYSKILFYIFDKTFKVGNTSSQSFFNTKFEKEDFPFDLAIKSGDQEIEIARQRDYTKYDLKSGDWIIVKMRDNPNFDFMKLNTYSSHSSCKDQSQFQKTYTVTDPAIQDCLRLFSQAETLKHNQWKCEKCMACRQATKRVHFQSLPKILILSLNRFKSGYNYQDKNMNFYKHQKLIKYSQFLDMSEFMDNRSKKWQYRLHSVIFHKRLDDVLTEVSQMSGHYFSMIRNGESWRKYDDEEVTSVEAKHVLSNRSAYILFYEKIQE